MIDTDVDDIVTVDIDGNWLEGRIEPVDERFLHLEIMKARPDVTSVVHAHPTYATAFGIAGVNILPVGNRGAIFAPQVPILDFDRQIDTPERGRMCRDAIGDGLALILQESRRRRVRRFNRECHYRGVRPGGNCPVTVDCGANRTGAKNFHGRSAQRAHRRTQGRILQPRVGTLCPARSVEFGADGWAARPGPAVKPVASASVIISRRSTRRPNLSMMSR